MTDAELQHVIDTARGLVDLKDDDCFVYGAETMRAFAQAVVLLADRQAPLLVGTRHPDGSTSIAVAPEAPAVVRTTGRSDLADLWRLSGILEATKLNHTPFLAFTVEGVEVRVNVVKSAAMLVQQPWPDVTPIMVQWTGKIRSDWFHMSLGDVRHAYAECHDARKRAVVVAVT